MGCGSSSSGAVITTQQSTVVTPQYNGTQTVAQYPSSYPQQAQSQTVVVQDRDRGGDLLVGMAAGAVMANALHGPHYYGHGSQIHIHDHDHFHSGGDHFHEHHHYGGPEYHEHYGDTGGFDGGGGFDDGGGFDGGGFDDGGGLLILQSSLCKYMTIKWYTNECILLSSYLIGDKRGNSKILFPEYELVIETEPDENEEIEKSEKDRLDEFKQFMKTNELLTDMGSDKELESLASLGKEALLADKQFRKFKKRIAREPKQVLRYHQNGEPLWVSDEGKPSKDDIPRCKCGSERVFEFQIMPQLLNYLHVDSLEESADWGTLLVYTCAQSCGDGSSYQTEYIWKQNFADTGIPITALGTG
ncbi:Programmed cell death protein 2 [Stylophora pistillata]|uniref:Programmed cell death protein 2 n=1 Tax=Stylophora pistillata TaxID=50429 RepID=A0A2B4T285_STYPI|nr:Programmed cell death protein 2 [Stylophora pistillata]